ncbi:MAG: alpha-galactosidase [Planctomycetaceae bacterium]|nr:alpha-galactosidase [Planctomycetaceae bacterium]
MTSSEFLKSSPKIVLADGRDGAAAGLRVEGVWQGDLWRGRLINAGGKPQAIKEIVLFGGQLPVPPETAFYGEGYQKLSQYSGTIALPKCIGGYTDKDHYKLPQTPGAFTVYSLLLLGPAQGRYILAAFTSCRRFSGEFRLWPDGRAEIVLAAEGIVIESGEAWELEEFFVQEGPDREALLAAAGEQIARNHPPLPFAPVPTGWCSWYYYGPNITEADIRENLDAMTARIPQLKYVQIDDGYQTHMGDWLTPAPGFGDALLPLLGEIRRRGLEPAIWVGPFIASEASELFRTHPEYFVQDAAGKPLRSDTISFGGWRDAPWYMLDGTHPGAQAYLERVFRTMRREWGCTYFKLDANSWGAIPGGVHHDRKATSIEAYRRGMAAVLRGAEDAFVLGCNAPMWGSLGLVHGMRVTNDIGRSWGSFKAIATELFHRNWQHGRLWINDPDCVVLENTPGATATADEYRFHMTMIYACAGMVLSGDKLSILSQESIAILKKLVPPPPAAATFEDATFRLGVIDLPDKRMACLFNWTDEPITIDVPLPRAAKLRDFWTGEDLGRHGGSYRSEAIAPHGAQLVECMWT